MSFTTDLARAVFGRTQTSRYGRLGTALTVAGLVRRRLRQHPVILYRAEVKPGDRFELVGREREPRGRRERKQAAKLGRKAEKRARKMAARRK
ncbi:MAG: hypothetical protein U0V73_09950 [Acidimicrobiia bacterium]